MSYQLSSDNKKEKDKTANSQGIEIVYDSKTALYIEDLIIDYKAGFDGSGWAFVNPKYSKTCGCGNSFQTR